MSHPTLEGWLGIALIFLVLAILAFIACIPHSERLSNWAYRMIGPGWEPPF